MTSLCTLFLWCHLIQYRGSLGTWLKAHVSIKDTLFPHHLLKIVLLVMCQPPDTRLVVEFAPLPTRRVGLLVKCRSFSSEPTTLREMHHHKYHWNDEDRCLEHFAKCTEIDWHKMINTSYRYVVDTIISSSSQRASHFPAASCYSLYIMGESNLNPCLF